MEPGALWDRCRFNKMAVVATEIGSVFHRKLPRFGCHYDFRCNLVLVVHKRYGRVERFGTAGRNPPFAPGPWLLRRLGRISHDSMRNVHAAFPVIPCALFFAFTPANNPRRLKKWPWGRDGINWGGTSSLDPICCAFRCPLQSAIARLRARRGALSLKTALMAKASPDKVHSVLELLCLQGNRQADTDDTRSKTAPCTSFRIFHFHGSLKSENTTCVFGRSHAWRKGAISRDLLP